MSPRAGMINRKTKHKHSNERNWLKCWWHSQRWGLIMPSKRVASSPSWITFSQSFLKMCLPKKVARALFSRSIRGESLLIHRPFCLLVYQRLNKVLRGVETFSVWPRVTQLLLLLLLTMWLIKVRDDCLTSNITIEPQLPVRNKSRLTDFCCWWWMNEVLAQNAF